MHCPKRMHADVSFATNADAKRAYAMPKRAYVCHAEARVCGRSKSWMSTKNRQRDFNDGYSAKGSSARGSSAKGNSVIGNVTSPLTFHEMKNDFPRNEN